MAGTPILNLPSAVVITGAEWIPAVALQGDAYTTVRFQAGLLFDITAVGAQAANVVLAGPASGDAAAPAFRALELDDMPAALDAQIVLFSQVFG